MYMYLVFQLGNFQHGFPKLREFGDCPIGFSHYNKALHFVPLFSTVLYNGSNTARRSSASYASTHSLSRLVSTCLRLPRYGPGPSSRLGPWASCEREEQRWDWSYYIAVISYLVSFRRTTVLVQFPLKWP